MASIELDDLFEPAAFAAQCLRDPSKANTVRWAIHERKRNGLEAAGGTVRLGRKILINRTGFRRWLEQRNPK